MAKGKGYKLTSATGDGTPKTCAFFFSDQGCRNGDACKFSHTQQPAATSTCPSATASVSSSSVCSSESDESDDGEIIEKKAGAYASLANGEVDIRNQQAPACSNPFLSPNHVKKNLEKYNSAKGGPKSENKRPEP